MINLLKNNLLYFIIFSIFFLAPKLNDAKEILIYADNITYDKDENIIARGNAKIFHENHLILSELIIYEVKDKNIKIPGKFTFKDNLNNYYNGKNGFFSQNFNIAEFEEPRIRLNDGSRIVGKKIKRNGFIDIISKGVYTPCKSRIKIANFICPTWQLEGEKILHDNKNLFLYQKHSKMRVLNTPVFYIPYIVTPSPLRKNRKSGFLTPSLSTSFFDTKTSQSFSLPYYFNIAIDKELLFTPIINYGGGVDTSQRFKFDYNQKLSGGHFKTELGFDSNFENQNNNKWLTNASLITKYEKNLNKKFRINIDSALQTAKDYIQITKPNDDLSYTNSLKSQISLEGFNLNKKDDYLLVNFSFYQSNQQDEDNKTIPSVFPNVEYYSGVRKYNYIDIYDLYESYNILRDKNTDVHAKRQQKLSHKFNIESTFIKYNSNISINAEIYNQIFNTEKKLISGKFHSGSYYRFFPILSIKNETPFKLKNSYYNLTFKPISQIILSPGISNSNKLSNEDSTNNNFSLENILAINRYSGTDKMDNSKRLNYGINIYNDNLKFDIYQTYEFTDNSNFHKEQGNVNNLSDILGSIEYEKEFTINYDFRYDVNLEYLKNQNLKINTTSKIGDVELFYLDQQSKSDGIINKDSETINYNFKSKRLAKFSKINLNGLYDLKKEINTEYGIGYSYFDECFGISLDFNRKSYKEDELKPQDILTLMFSFKNVGSYKSSNLSLSNNNQEDINWESTNIDEDMFLDYE